MISAPERQSLIKWKYRVKTDSIIAPVLDPGFNILAQYIPRQVSPNLLSLMGLGFTIMAWYISTTSYTDLPGCVLIASCIILYTVLDAVDGIHARNTGMSSALGELLDHGCDCFSNILVTTTMLNLYHVPATYYWPVAISNCLVFTLEHYNAFIASDKTIHFGRYNGPYEALAGSLILVLVPVPLAEYIMPVALIGYGLYAYVIQLTSAASKGQLDILFCLACLPYYYHIAREPELTQCTAFLVICMELIYAKMTERPSIGLSLSLSAVYIHLASMCAPVGLPLSVGYFIYTLYSISCALDLPFLSATSPSRAGEVADCHTVQL